MKKKTKKKIRIKGLFFLLLCIYLVGMLFYYLFSVSNKALVVKGNSLLSEYDVIKASKLTENTSIFKVLTSNPCKKISKLDLVDSCKLRINYKGIVSISIVENKILFFDILNNSYLLSNNKQYMSNQIVGYPILVNYVPKETLKDLVKGLSIIDVDIIKMISEIEYSPSKFNDVVIDESRFILRMNDGNEVYINTVNIKKLNKYQKIYPTLPDKGILYLDSNNKTYIFKKFGEQNEG